MGKIMNNINFETKPNSNSWLSKYLVYPLTYERKVIYNGKLNFFSHDLDHPEESDRSFLL